MPVVARMLVTRGSARPACLVRLIASGMIRPKSSLNVRTLSLLSIHTARVARQPFAFQAAAKPTNPLRFRAFSDVSSTAGKIGFETLHDYQKTAENTMLGLLDDFEQLIEEHEEGSSFDVGYSDGVLNLDLGKHGTYVINTQRPNRQIWLSSPVSGPKRYDFHHDSEEWVYSHDNMAMHDLLESELSSALGMTVTLSRVRDL